MEGEEWELETKTKKRIKNQYNLLNDARVKSKRGFYLLNEEGNKEEIKKDEIINVPVWQAEFLIRENLAEPIYEKINNETLMRILSLEQLNTFSLYELPKDFYLNCLHTLEQLKKSKDKAANDFLNRLENLITLRLQKILKMAAKNLEKRKEREKMTAEEELLYDWVRKLVNDWVKSLIV